MCSTSEEPAARMYALARVSIVESVPMSANLTKCLECGKIDARGVVV